MTKEDLQELRSLMREELRPIEARLDGMDKRLDGMDKRLDGVDKRLDGMESRLERLEEKVDIIQEDTATTRGVANTLLDWADKAQFEVRIPLLPKKE